MTYRLAIRVYLELDEQFESFERPPAQIAGCLPVPAGSRGARTGGHAAFQEYLCTWCYAILMREKEA